MSWWVIALRVILGIILVLAVIATGLFGYIAWRARAKKWSGGMFAITILSIFLFYWLVLFDPAGIMFWP